MFGFRRGISRLSLISTTALGLVLATTSAFAQVTPSGGTSNILNTPLGATQTAIGQGVIGVGANGTTTVVGTGTLLEFTNSNAFPSFGDAELQIGTSTGTGLLHIHGGGTVTIEPDMTGGDDAFLRISEVPGPGFSPAAMQGTVIVGNDPNTIANETGGTLRVISAPANSNNDATIDVGREGPGIFIATDSMIEVITTGTNTSDSALFQIGGRSGSSNNATAVGNVTISNSTVTVDAQGAGGSVVSVGRGTAHPDPATAPENTLLINSNSTFNNVATGTGSATFNVARDGTRGTATIDGAGTTLNVDDTINIGRDGGFGTMNVQNNGVVNNTGGDTIVGTGVPGSTGTLNITGGGTLKTAGTALIGNGFGNKGTVTISGNDSTLDSGSAVDPLINFSNIVGLFTGSDGSLTANSGGDVIARGTMGVGIAGGKGVVDIDGNGSTLTVDKELFVGLDALSDGMVSVRNSATASAERISVGKTGKGKLDVTQGGEVNTRRIQIASAGGDGAVTIAGAGSKINVETTKMPPSSALVGVGGDTGGGTNTGGTLKINDGGELNINAGAGARDAVLFISSSFTGGAPVTLPGTVIVGDDPSTSDVESGGTINILSDGDDAEIAVGRAGQGTLIVTDSVINIITTGLAPLNSAQFQIGGRSGGNVNNNAVAVGNVTINNSTFTMDAQGAGATVLNLGRSTNTVSNPDPMTAPESTLVIENGSTVDVKNTGTGSATMSVGRDGARATATIDGIGTTLNVDDTINIGRDGGFGTMKVQNNATVNNTGGDTRVGTGSPGGTGVLNINSGGKLITAGTAIISNGTATKGTASVSGDGSTLDSGSALTPATFSNIVGTGAGSDGSLTANMGGDVIARTTMGVGIDGGKGVVDIDGVGSSLTVTNALSIATGANGDGMVTVQNGATASAEFIALGVDATSVGSLKIQNGASVMTTSGPLTTSLDVGRFGTGSVEISGGSQYNSTGATVLGSEAGSEGTVSVTGTGSEMNSGRPIQVGRTGKGTLNILQGAEANAKTLQIGNQGGEGTVNISGAGSKINIETTDNTNPTAAVAVGGDSGAGTNTGGTLKINNGGELNITSGATAGDAILFISRTSTGGAPVTLPGAVILGDDPSTGGVESGGTLNITSNSELAEIVVGRAGEGTLRATDSVINLTGAGPESALFVIGGRSGGNVNNNSVSKGDVTFTNSTVTVDATGGGNTVFSVGRGTDRSVNTPMTAPENTLLVEGASTLNVINTGGGTASFNVARDGTRGTATIDGIGTTLNVDDTINIGRNGGFGTMRVQNGGTVTNKGNTTNIGIGTPGSTGVLNVNSGGTFNEATAINVGSAGNTGTLNVDGGGNVVIGFDPVGLPGGTGNTSEDAIVSVGLEEVGTLNVTNNSALNITAIGPGPSDSSLLQIGGRYGDAGNNTANARGDMLVDNSTVTMDATGDGSTVVSVGRGIDSTVHTDPATAPENTLTIQNGSIFSVKNTGTGSAFFNVARDNTRGTATIDGTGTTLNTEDFINIGRDGGSGTMNIQNSATVNHMASVGDALVRVGMDTGVGPAGGGGTLNVKSGGTLNVSSTTGGDDASLLISEGSQGGTAMRGTVNVETGGKINITAGNNGTNSTGSARGNDAILSVGREGPGSFTATESSVEITALGTRSIDNATVEIGGGGRSNITGAVGHMTLRNSNLTVQTSGAGAFASIIVGRATTAANAASAPENTFVAEAGSVVTVQGLSTGNAGFTAGDNGTKATVTFRGTGTTLNVDDFVNVGRRSALGVMNVKDNAVINNNIDSGSRARIGRQGGNGTLNITTGGTFNGNSVEIGIDGTGTVNVATGGALFANNIVNGANGTLTGGGGSITGMVTAETGSTIAPGNSTGLMTVFGNVDLMGGSTLEIELGGTNFDTGLSIFEYDRLFVQDDLSTTAIMEGIVTIAAGSIFDISEFGAFNADRFDTFDIIVADSIIGDISLSTFILPEIHPGQGWITEIVMLGNGDQALRLRVVSEPGTLLVLLGGLSGIAIIRRRRRRT